MSVAAKHVLVVEDDAGIRSLLEDLLVQDGYAVTVAQTGNEALAKMQAHRPDLMVLDLMLPDMDGWSLLQARERDTTLAEVPVLVVSATSATGQREAEAVGAPIFLAKPFDNAELLSEVRRLCREPVRQCAWCRRVMSPAGEFNLSSGRKLRWATHGICPTCQEAERRQLLS